MLGVVFGKVVLISITTYIDRIADATNEDETLTFVTARNVVIRVRNTSILDFDKTGTIGTGGLTVGTVRNPDNVYAP